MGLLLHQLDAVFDVLVAHVGEEAAQDPGDEIVEVDEANKGQPEPHKHEDFFVEQIDGQDTLNGVGVHLSNVSDFEVAHGDAREIDGVGGILARQDVLHDLHAVQVEVLMAQEDVEEEQLTNGVGEVEYLDEEVEDNEVGAADGTGLAAAAGHVSGVGAGTTAARGVGEAQLLDVAVALFADAALALAARVRVLVDGLDHIEHDLVAVVELLGALVGAGGLDQVGDVEAGFGREGAPHQAWCVEEERLEEQDERNPLVVLQDATLSIWMILG